MLQRPLDFGPKLPITRGILLAVLIKSLSFCSHFGDNIRGVVLPEDSAEALGIVFGESGPSYHFIPKESPLASRETQRSEVVIAEVDDIARKALWIKAVKFQDQIEKNLICRKEPFTCS